MELALANVAGVVADLREKTVDLALQRLLGRAAGRGLQPGKRRKRMATLDFYAKRSHEKTKSFLHAP
eukprot:879772-Pleurochrysis_carterae.AAC.1